MAGTMTSTRAPTSSGHVIFLFLLLAVFVAIELCSQTKVLTALQQHKHRLSTDTNTQSHVRTARSQHGRQGKEGGTPHGSSVDRAGGTSSNLQLVICSRVRNEAPYLKEWIEYHRMIGFESFLLMNDNSTDDTQCLLDAYAQEGVVIRMPEDVDNGTLRLNSSNYVFDACTRYLNDRQDRFDPRHTWMMTHDTDEFVYFNQTERVRSLGDAMTNLIQHYGASIKSMLVPRFLVGSSGQEHYDSRLVIDRFARRFNLASCPGKKRLAKNHLSHFRGLRRWDSRLGRKRGLGEPRRRHGNNQRRRLFNQNNPTSYCQGERHTSFDLAKSISHAASIAQNCSKGNKRTGKVVSDQCVNTHRHKLKRPEVSSERNKGSPASMPPYLSQGAVGTSIVIMHYMTKSREEFYQRACASKWLIKYGRCEECSPETYFNLTMEYANNYQDDRMAPFSEQLKPILEASTVGENCNTQPVKHSLEYYRECLDHGKRILDP